MNYDIRVKLLVKNGFNPEDMSAEEWLELAILSEQQAKACGPFDIAYEYLSRQAKYSMEAACLAEVSHIQGGK